MAESFSGRWRLTVIARNAGFSQRFRVAGADTGNGAYPGDVGVSAVISGAAWTVELEWNDDAGSGWQPSAVLRSDGTLSPLVRFADLFADDSPPAERDGDFDDLVVRGEDLDPVFDVVQRPFAVDRGTLTMLPDGIFEAGQGVLYMGVRVRNTGWFDWPAGAPMLIGIAPASRVALQSRGIRVLDAWSTAEQQALQQQMSNGFVRVPAVPRGTERLVYFKVDASGARPAKPAVAFVAQAPVWDPAYAAPTRQVRRQIFVSRSTYDPTTRELVAELPEGRLQLRMTKVVVDRLQLREAVRHGLTRPCRRPPRPGAGGAGGADDAELLRAELREFLWRLLDGGRVDPCRLRELLQSCCDGGDLGGKPGGGHRPGEPVEPGRGGLADGPGADDWCRARPVSWLPVEFEYRLVPTPAYAGQFGPLAFEDPWWKVVLIILAVLLAVASLIYDYVFAGQDPQFVIGRITSRSDKAADNVDAAVALLNGARAIDLDVLEAQADDRNNGLPVNGTTGGTVGIDRSDNGDRGIADPVVGNVVFKSGARSGTTRGRVDDVDLTTEVGYDDGSVSYTGQVFIVPLPAPADQPVSQGGDSGSLWADLISRRPVALNFAGPTSDDGSNAVANPIRDVVDLFGIRFNP